MLNPITRKELSKAEEREVQRLRTARRNARKLARSGHPGRSAQGRRLLLAIPEAIDGIYRGEVTR